MVATRHGTNTDPPELPQKELGPDVVDPFFNDQISMTSNEYIDHDAGGGRRTICGRQLGCSQAMPTTTEHVTCRP